MDTLNPDPFDIFPIIILGAIESAQNTKTPFSTGLPSSTYLRELLDCGNDKRIYSILRIKKKTFESLCLWLRRNTALQSSRNVLVEEQVAMFLWTINFDASSTTVAERFQHSGETIHR
jgi:hypothetical protein